MNNIKWLQTLRPFITAFITYLCKASANITLFPSLPEKISPQKAKARTGRGDLF